MSGKITTTVIESFLKCKTKARLKVQGQHGVPSDYELFLLEKRSETKRRAIEGILAKLGDQHAGVLRDLPATIPLLRQGAEYVLDTRVEDQSVSISFDARKKVSGTSSLGDFHYVPVLELDLDLGNEDIGGAKRSVPHWRVILISSSVVIVSFVVIVTGLPRRVAFRLSRPSIQRHIATAPLSTSEGEPMGRWLGVYHVDRYAADPRGGVYFPAP